MAWCKRRHIVAQHGAAHELGEAPLPTLGSGKEHGGGGTAISPPPAPGAPPGPPEAGPHVYSWGVPLEHSASRRSTLIDHDNNHDIGLT